MIRVGHVGLVISLLISSQPLLACRQIPDPIPAVFNGAPPPELPNDAITLEVSILDPLPEQVSSQAITVKVIQVIAPEEALQVPETIKVRLDLIHSCGQTWIGETGSRYVAGWLRDQSSGDPWFEAFAYGSPSRDLADSVPRIIDLSDTK